MSRDAEATKARILAAAVADSLPSGPVTGGSHAFKSCLCHDEPSRPVSEFRRSLAVATESSRANSACHWRSSRWPVVTQSVIIVANISVDRPTRGIARKCCSVRRSYKLSFFMAHLIGSLFTYQLVRKESRCDGRVLARRPRRTIAERDLSAGQRLETRLYRALGGEDELMDAALERYANVVLAPNFAAADTDAPLFATLEKIITSFTNVERAGPPGCLLARLQHTDGLGPASASELRTCAIRRELGTAR
ncbi:hypothetical protein GQR58_030677 [Nymphon striatum]|nr:hypothetical protein GQR58_030677 [Nymphon striatum]